MAKTGKKGSATAESMGRLQREISVSEFFVKNRHLLGFDNPRKALLTGVKEAVDNSLDACDEAGILPEISVEIRQSAEKRFLVSVADNGPGIVRAQIPKIFAKLLYGSKFHRLRMSRGQQGIGISAACMYGQLTTGKAAVISSRTRNSDKARRVEVLIDTKTNKPNILKDELVDWRPSFPVSGQNSGDIQESIADHGTCVTMEMEASYVRGKLSVDEYLAQTAIVNPHLCLHYRIITGPASPTPEDGKPEDETPWITFERVSDELPVQPNEIKPHPHGVELGMLMQMLKVSGAKTIKTALMQDFSRISPRVALEICDIADLNPATKPTAIANRESEALFKALGSVKIMRPPTDCLSPIGEEQILAGLKKEIQADFYTAVTRNPDVYRGNPFQVEVGLAYARPGDNSGLGSDDPVRLMRFANKVPLLYMSGACAVTKAVSGVNWKAYGLAQPKGSLPLGPVALLVHIASVWVPFTSESKEAIAHYPEIIKEITFALQDAGRKLAAYLSKRRRQAEQERKRNYIEMYLPHLALGLKEILNLNERQEKQTLANLHKMLEKTHLKGGG